MLGSNLKHTRKKRSLYRKFKDLFSLKKMFRGFLYNYWKLLRNPDDLQRLARGFAFGVAVSFTPFIGFHIILILLFSLLFRSSFMAGVIGSLVGNPITFPFIWIIVFWTGRHLVAENMEAYSSQEVINSLLNLKDVILQQDAQAISLAYEEFLYPMIIGCIPYFLASYVVFYYISYYMIESYRKKRFEKIYKGAKVIVKKVVDEVVEDVVAVEKKIEHTFDVVEKTLEHTFDGVKKTTSSVKKKVVSKKKSTSAKKTVKRKSKVNASKKPVKKVTAKKKVNKFK